MRVGSKKNLKLAGRVGSRSGFSGSGHKIWTRVQLWLTALLHPPSSWWNHAPPRSFGPQAAAVWALLTPPYQPCDATGYVIIKLTSTSHFLPTSSLQSTVDQVTCVLNSSNGQRRITGRGVQGSLDEKSRDPWTDSQRVRTLSHHQSDDFYNPMRKF